MGLFDAFKKKQCSICGGDIGLLGNRKLEDGNMCKNCAKKLSPFFSDRRNSTVAEIEAQLAYREDNKQAVAAFNVTRSLGSSTKILIDEDAGKFLVTDARDLAEENPDVLDFSQVTGVELDIDEDASEEMREITDKDGNTKEVSYVPPKFTWTYDFHVVIRVNHPYFDEIRFRLNDSDVELNPGNPQPQMRKPNPKFHTEYREYEQMGKEIKQILTEARQQVRAEAKAAAAPKQAVTCPWCGATTTPDAGGCCEYCGGAIQA